MIEVIRSLVRSRRFKIPDMTKKDYPPESNMAMKHLPSVDDFLIQTSIYLRVSIAKMGQSCQQHGGENTRPAASRD